MDDRFKALMERPLSEVMRDVHGRQERAAIVSWLRDLPRFRRFTRIERIRIAALTDSIEKCEHLKSGVVSQSGPTAGNGGGSGNTSDVDQT
jgi:hypothetical protein